MHLLVLILFQAVSFPVAVADTLEERRALFKRWADEDRELYLRETEKANQRRYEILKKDQEARAIEEMRIKDFQSKQQSGGANP